jgi:enamine deaminase RidA (YjgF/YER057c/UK114 family)
MIEILQPAAWPRPRGYANGVVAEGERMVFIAGQVGWNAQQRFEHHDLAGQTRQALQNIVTLLAEAGAGPEHLTRLTWYLLDKRDYLAHSAAIGAAYREVIGRHFPAMSAVQVSALIEDAALVEIEATAVLPRPLVPDRP